MFDGYPIMPPHRNNSERFIQRCRVFLECVLWADVAADFKHRMAETLATRLAYDIVIPHQLQESILLLCRQDYAEFVRNLANQKRKGRRCCVYQPWQQADFST